MIAVLVLSGPFAEMHGLDAERSPAMLALGDRPAIQHVIESLVGQGVRQFELIASHAPERLEFLLGNGDRWGVHIRYHLASNPEQPYRSLRVISGLADEPWLLLHVERYPCREFAADLSPRPLLYRGRFRDDWHDNGSVERWGGAVLLPDGRSGDEFAAMTPDELAAHFAALEAAGEADGAACANWLNIRTPAGLLRSQEMLLKKDLPGFLINGIERENGVWISRNVTLHPSASLIAPVYIGPNSRIGKNVSVGPNVVIGTNCIVADGTTIADAMIVAGSYIGEALEVQASIVSHQLLVNARLNASIDIADHFLIGRLEQPAHRKLVLSRFGQMVTAIFLLLLLLPVTLLAVLFWLLRGRLPALVAAMRLPADDRPAAARTFALPVLGADAWAKHRPAGWAAFTRQFLPGLAAVAFGKLALVGLPPRTEEQVARMDGEWRDLYLNGNAGLITEAAIAAPKEADEMQLYLSDAYYAVRRSPGHDFRLALKYFARLFTPAPRL